MFLTNFFLFFFLKKGFHPLPAVIITPTFQTERRGLKQLLLNCFKHVSSLVDGEISGTLTQKTLKYPLGLSICLA